MKTHLPPKARNESIKGETTLMEANHEHSSIFVPRLLQWKDILSKLKFLDNPTRRSSSNRKSSWSPSTSCPSRLVPRPPSSSKTLEEAEDDDIISVAYNSKGKVTGVNFSGNVPKVFYQYIPSSPTANEMDPPKEKPAWLGMLKTGKDFEPNLDIIHEQWIHPDN
ncbi:hypothetical protein H5410_056478 [Solanum commersonii]|uniref:Uncharacterized protein n=1 Tax=Solanum commersonii TaxID=4109 RepID=A0A9J5WMT1_SOLCO|nr:hypothetical protein H5410_056478 [Solanum commersonii]